jgi:hypothetical protein
MPDASPALVALRASRGYLFSVVACAVVLVALATIQYLHRSQTAAQQVVFISTAGESGGDVPAWLEKDLHEAFLSERALTAARGRLATAQCADQLPPNAALRASLSASVVLNGPSSGKSIRLGSADASPEGLMLLRTLAEHFIETRLTGPRANAEGRIQSAQDEAASVRLQHQPAAAQLQEIERDVERVTKALGEQEILVAQARRKVHAPRQGPGTELPPADRADPQRSDLERLLVALQEKRAQLLSQFTIQHPLVQDVDNRIAEVSAALLGSESPSPPPQGTPPADAEETQRASRTAAAEYAAAQRKLQMLQEELSSLELQRDSQAASLAGLAQDLRQREADAKRAQEDFERLKGIELTINEGRSASFEPPGSSPSGLLFSLSLGCLLGFVVFLRAVPVTRRFSNRSQIESILALPVIGLLPGTDDSPDPYSPVELPGLVHRVRLAAEVTLALFCIATIVGMGVLEGYQARLVAEPLSSVADSLHALARHFFA